MAEVKMTKFRIAVPTREGFKGVWVPGKFLPPGDNTVDLPEMFDAGNGAAPVPMEGCIRELENLGVTLLEFGPALEARLAAESKVADPEADAKAKADAEAAALADAKTKADAAKGRPLSTK